MLPAGTIAYTVGTPPVVGKGLSWSVQETEAAVKGPVAAVVHDDAGTEAINTLLSGLPETGFTTTNVNAALAQSDPVENWRVGEAVAECYLTHHRDCHFPWPDGRDIRKRRSSLPGADLVGFHKDGAKSRFAFGEVKTSSDAAYPPGACYGHTGLKKQLEDLRDNSVIRDDLVRYLGHRAVTGPAWKNQFKDAATLYFANKTDVRVFGMMVRDVPPHKDDVRVRVTALAKDCPAKMGIELLALYLPANSIKNLGNLAARPQTGGAA